MPSPEDTGLPEDLVSVAQAAADPEQPANSRRQALRTLAVAANDMERSEEVRDRIFDILAGTAADNRQAEDFRQEAFAGLRPVIGEQAARVARFFGGQLGQDLLHEAESYIWERLGKFEPGRFRSWCHTVLTNLIRDWQRRRQADPVGRADPVDEEELHDAGHQVATLSLDDITKRLSAQIVAIRRAFPAPERGIPFGAVLLLSERLTLANAVAAANFPPKDGRTSGHDTVSEIVKIIAGWEAGDAARLIPPHDMRLDQAWELIRERTYDRPQEPGPKLVADVLKIDRGVWNTWVSRARTRCVQRLGPAAARRLFPLWPEGPFERAAEGAEP